MYNRDPFYVNPHMSLVYTNTKGVCLWLGDYSAAVNEKNLKKYDIMAGIIILTKFLQLQKKTKYHIPVI